MNTRITTLLLFFLTSLTLAAAPASRPLTYKPAPGPEKVATTQLTWHDPKRNRDVPVKIYYPATPSSMSTVNSQLSTAPYPIILFSHGLGGSRETYAYLGQHWASHGYVCVHLQHAGSDTAVWANARPAERMAALRRAVANPMNALERPRDVSFAIDQLERIAESETDPLAKKLDLDHIGIAGHSFGAWTVQAVVGQIFSLAAADRQVVDTRIKAAIAMSPNVPERDHSAAALDHAFSDVRVPVFHMTGTLDDSPIGSTTAAQRRLPFDHTKPLADQYLLILNGADHMVFSGRFRNPGSQFAGTTDGANDDLHHALILQSSTAFWDTYLKSNAPAKTWLTTTFPNLLAANGTFEQKPAAKNK